MMLQLVNGVLTTPNLDEDHGKGWILQAHLLPSLMIWIAMEILLYKARRIKTKIPRITLRMMAVIKSLILVIKSRNDTFTSELKSTRELQSKNNLTDQHNVSPIMTLRRIWKF